MTSQQEFESMIATFEDVPVKYLGQMAVPKLDPHVIGEGAECEQAIRFLSEKGSRKEYRHAVPKDVNLTVARTATGGELVAKSKNKEHFRVPLASILGIGVVSTKFAFHIDPGTGQTVVYAFQLKRRGVDDPFLKALTEGTLLNTEEDQQASAARGGAAAADRLRSNPEANARIQQLEQQLSDAAATVSAAETARLSAMLRWVTAEREIGELKTELANMRTEMAGLTAEVATDMTKLTNDMHDKSQRNLLAELNNIKAAMGIIFHQLPGTPASNLWDLVHGGGASAPSQQHRQQQQHQQAAAAANASGRSSNRGSVVTPATAIQGVDTLIAVAEDEATLREMPREQLLAIIRQQASKLRDTSENLKEFSQVQADLMDATMQNHNMAEEIEQLQQLHTSTMAKLEQEKRFLADTIAGSQNSLVGSAATASVPPGGAQASAPRNRPSSFNSQKNANLETMSDDGNDPTLLLQQELHRKASLSARTQQEALRQSAAPTSTSTAAAAGPSRSNATSAAAAAAATTTTTKPSLPTSNSNATIMTQPDEEEELRMDEAAAHAAALDEQSALETISTVRFIKTPRGLGFSIAGGVDDPIEPGDTGVYITMIIDGSPAQECGGLVVGDRILSVNGTSLVNVTHQEAVSVLQKAGTDIELQVGRINQPEEEVIEIVLVKGSTGLGFSIAGGTDHPIESGDPFVYITMIIPGSAAALDGRLRVGDKVLEVNECDMTNITHDDAVRVLQQSPQEVHMIVARLPEGFITEEQDVGPAPANEDVPVYEDVMEIEFERSATGGLGFSIAGGTDDPVDESDNFIYVTQIIEGGPAKLDGRLQVGDRLLTVNGVDLNNVTHDEAVRALKLDNQRVKLLIYRMLSVTMKVSEISFPKGAGGLGFSISGGLDDMDSDDPSIYVTQIIAGGSAERDGRLCVGDRIVEVNGYSLRDVHHDQAVQFLQSDPTGVHLKIERIFEGPLMETYFDVSLKKGTSGLGFSIAGGIDDCVEEGDASIYITNITEGGAAHQDGRLRFGDKLVEVNGISMVDVTHEDAVGALMMDPTGVVMRVARLPDNQPGEETFQIEFPKLSTGLGFSIAGGIDDAVSPGDTAIYVTNIVPGGSAELDGRLKFEDRVLAANGHNFGCISHAQAVKILQSNPTGVKLIVSRFIGEEPLDESCA